MSHPWVIIPARECEKVEAVGSNVQTLLSTFTMKISHSFDFRKKSTKIHPELKRFNFKTIYINMVCWEEDFVR